MLYKNNDHHQSIILQYFALFRPNSDVSKPVFLLDSGEDDIIVGDLDREDTNEEGDSQDHAGDHRSGFSENNPATKKILNLKSLNQQQNLRIKWPLVNLYCP